MMPPSSSSTSSTLRSLIALQLVSRVFTFILNQSLLRLTSPEAFGTASIQFELLLNTILFLSREGVRNALLRNAIPSFKPKEANDENRKRQRILNIAYLPFLCGIPLAVGTCALYAWRASDETREQPHFFLAVALYIVAAVIELAAEPMHNIAMSESLTNLRVRAEGLGVTLRTSTTFAVLFYDVNIRHTANAELALLAFALGQLSYGLALFGVYVRHYGFAFLVPDFKCRFDSETLKLSKTMSSQSLIKHVLTEGDKFLLSWLTPLQDQGGYAVAINYGSLVARIILQPVEETARIYFSKSSNIQPKTDKKEAKSDPAYSYLTNLLRVLLTLSLLLCTFAPPYLPLILPYLLPYRYLTTSAPRILGAWIYYIPVLALNGVLEAFHDGVAGIDQVGKQSRYMTLFSLIYVASSVVLFTVLKMGDVALVYANMMNLVARIVFCVHYATGHFRGKGVQVRWGDVLPRKVVVLAAVIARVGIAGDERRLGLGLVTLGEKIRVIPLRQLGEHVVVGTLMGVGCVVVWWISEGRPMPRRTSKSKVQ